MRDDSSLHPPQQGQVDLEEMWKSLLACDWNSLAVVPTDYGVSVQAVVDALRSTSASSNPPVRLIDARGLDVAEGKNLARDLAVARSERARVVVIVDPLIRSLSGVHPVQEVGSVLLVVRVGAMDIDALTSTVAIIGTERIVGSVTAPPVD